MKPVFAGIASILLAIGVSASEPPTVQVGPLDGNRFQLATGWVLEPAGKQIPLSTFPMASAISPDGRHLLILQGGYKKPSVTVFSLPELKPVSSLELEDGWLGLQFAPGDGGLFYVSGGSTASVYELQLSSDGSLAARRTFTLVASAERKHSDFVGDIALSPDGRRLYAAGLHRDSLWVIDLESGTVLGEWKSAHRPYRLLFHPDGRSLFVTGWGDGLLHQHDAVSGAVMSRLHLGSAPMDMLWRNASAEVIGGEEGEKADPFKRRLYVALSNTNLVAVLGETGTGQLREIERINVALSPVSPPGMTPSALALTPDENRLYVVCADANALAVVDVSTTRTQVAGFIPTGWYPTAARGFGDGSLLVFNGRGDRSFPNPGGPNPGRTGSPLHQGIRTDQYVAAMQNGTMSHIGSFEPGQLATWTTTVLRNSPFNPRKLEDAGVPAGSVVPNVPGGPTPIRHVMYIVKENRTYDQVLGDLEIGNGDPSLTLFGEDVTPNQHKLAREFVLLDNFYVNADVSADGHNWTSAAIAPAYVQRMWPNSYGRRRQHYDYEGGERAALPPSGYIWNNVLAAGLTLRNYGYWCSNIQPAPAQGVQIAAVRDPALTPHTSMTFRAYDLQYPDINRARAFIAELAEFERKGEFPRFCVLRIGNNHTSGTARDRLTPKAMVADNDQALGMIVEAMSKSSFWPHTAIFVLEDDAQNGPDHVDSHRSPAFVLSPYTRGRGVDSSMYNTVSMLRTMELILGVGPMTLHDAGARPMAAAFRNEPDLRPYSTIPARHPLDERNVPSLTSIRSERMNWVEADMIDDNELNDILWLAIKGVNAPSPTRSYFSLE